MKNTKTVGVISPLKQQQLEVCIEELEVDGILAHIDIVAAIEYYGVTELLDIIGEENLKSHLASL